MFINIAYAYMVLDLDGIGSAALAFAYARFGGISNWQSWRGGRVVLMMIRDVWCLLLHEFDWQAVGLIERAE